MIFRWFWKSCHFIPQLLASKLRLSSGLKWSWASLESLHIQLAVEFYQSTTSCFAALLYSGPLYSTCQCGFSLPTRPWLQQAYLCRRLCDEQKPIKVFKWMLLFSVHTMEIFHVFNWQSVKELDQNDNKPRRAINTTTLSDNGNTPNNTRSSPTKVTMWWMRPFRKKNLGKPLRLEDLLEVKSKELSENVFWSPAALLCPGWIYHD